MLIVRQGLGKHVPEAASKQITIKLLLSDKDGDGVFCWISPRLYNEDPSTLNKERSSRNRA
jgi:hypothetical protein